ncbi:hypothetical protein KR054_009252 [Drosophila jambulina]|nr:hypothetical protein KR054_009252 [Drosophila jambulina]
MEQAMIEIINGLLCTETERIRASTAALMKAYETPESLLCLVHIVNTNKETQIRHYAAVLLNKRLSKLRQWLTVPAEHKASIKRDMLQALVAEEEKSVRNAVAQFVATLVKHEADKTGSWMPELLNYIFERCSSADPKESERGSSTYATLTAAAPDQFSVHMETICQLFSTVLTAAEAQGDLTTPTVSNMITGTSYLLPFIAGNTATEQTVVKVLPLVTKALHAIALKGNPERFLAVFDIFDSMAQYVPHLLTNVKLVLEFCLMTASNKQIEDGIRVPVIAFLGSLVHIKKKAIVKQKLLEPTLSVIFEIMCTETDPDDDEDYFVDESSNRPLTAAMQTLDLLAIHMPPEKLIAPLLQLLEPALQNPDPKRRSAAYHSMGMIAEGCSETISHKYLKVMLNIIKSGITDSAPEVRVAAFFALGQFSEYLQPEISKYAPLILPVLFDYLHQLVVELRGGQPEPKSVSRMFYAMDTFCENLGEDIVPHLPVLLERLFEILDPKNSPKIREFALCSVSSASEAAKEHLAPYFPRIFEILKTFLLKDVPEEMAPLRLQAIDTLASITRVMGKEHFLPLANDTKNYCLMMLDEGPNDPDFRRAIYGLIGALSFVVNESMAEVFPQVIPRLIQTVISTEEVELCLPDKPERDLILEAASAEEEIDLEHTDDEDDDELDGYQVENDYIVEKEVAIGTLRDFAANTGAAFTPYLQPAFENVYKTLDHASDDIRTTSATALCEFVAALNRSGDTAGVTRACEILIPKFSAMMRNDEVEEVLVHLLDEVGQLFRINKQPAMPNQECAELIYGCIRDSFLHKMTCQFNDQSGGGGEDDDDEESENADMILENAANLVASFGFALDPQTFSLYFGRLFHFLAQKLAKAKKNDQAEHRAYIYGTLADSFQSLGSCSATYFDTICPLFLAGANDTDAKSRQNSYYGLGELVMHSEDKSFESYPTILQTLSDAIARETAPSALDNICGAVARLILTNVQAVPLAAVLPVFLSHLPLREDFEEYDAVLKTFHLLYTQAAPSIVDQIEQMVYVILQALQQKHITDKDIITNAVEFVKLVRAHHPDKFNNVANSNPEMCQFVQTL